MRLAAQSAINFAANSMINAEWGDRYLAPWVMRRGGQGAVFSGFGWVRVS